MEQARALGQTTLIRDTHFHRYYTSDTARAVQTTKTVLERASRSEEASSSSVTLEPRLREVAKGAREGFSKSMSYEEALRERQKNQKDARIPLRETEDEAWNRIHAFIHELLAEEGRALQSTNNEQGIAPDKQTFNVFAMTHSGISRIFLRRLIGEEDLKRHPSARFDGDLVFFLPNTCVTILDIRLDDDNPSAARRSPYHNLQVDVIQLTWADHLGDQSSNVAFAE